MKHIKSLFAPSRFAAIALAALIIAPATLATAVAQDFWQQAAQNYTIWENYMKRGVAYFNQGDTDAAIAEFTKAISVLPRHPDSYAARGHAYRKKGDLKKALADFDKALEINPQHAEANAGRKLAMDSKR